MRIPAIFCFLALLPLFAQSAAADAPVGFGLWTPAQLQAGGERLRQKIGDKNMVFETLGNYKGHSAYLVLRGKTAPAEFHETESDLQIGVSGTAVFVIGGQLIDAKKLPRKQQQGSGIKGGTQFPVGPGDIIHVPVAVPHVLQIAPGKPYLYILIKLDEESPVPTPGK